MTDAHSLVGQRLRDYEVLELVGRGGMGAVYRARHVLLQEERAIKVVSRKPADDREFTERFVREARVLARLKDEHLVRLYEFWEDHGQLFMALEFLHGESVAQRLRERGRLSVGEAVTIARDAARGLKAAHEQNVVHRDISPDNLQLVRGPDGSEIVKVMDFGIAKALEEASSELTANMFLGKLEYASPEQCGFGLEHGEHIDLRSDVYSLGVTIFKMVTGSLPFTAVTPQGYLFKHAAEAPPPPSAVAAEAQIPVELDRLVLRALAKRRQERQQSMAELIDELKKIPTLPTTKAEAPTLALRPLEPTARPAPGAPRTSAGTGVGKTGALKIGDKFARKYVIKALLGEGGMGVVYRAVDTILDEPVALKVISERLVGGHSSVERMKREVVLARRVSHPNVCRIYDIGESEAGVPYVSMEYLDGRSLSDVIAEGAPLTLREGMPFIRQVLDALSAAHKVNVVHRDLKPDNIMITKGGRAVIMDFGLSLAEDSRRVTAVGSVIGTPHYMAPEQVRGSHVDPRTDLYAIGVILFRMFTARLPFSGGIVEILRDHLETPPPRPTEFNPKIPAALESIILTALEKDPARRFASAEEFLLALDPIEPANVRVSTESGRVVRVPRTQKGPATVIASAPTRAEGSEDDEDQQAVKDYLAQPTVQAEPARPTRVPDRTEPAPRPQRPKPAPPSRSPGRTGLVLGTAAAAVILAGLIGWRLTQSPVPASSISPDVPATGPAITVPAATLEPTPTQAPASPLVAPAATLRAAPSAAPRLPSATPGPAPTAPPATQAPATLSPATTVATPPPTTTMAPAPSTTLPSPRLSPEQGVRQAIEEYAAALGSRDDQRMIRIYPGFPPKNLEELRKAFKDYSVSVVALDKITVEPNRVFAEVRLRHTFTSFSGKQESETRKEKMIFFDAGGGWVRAQ